MSKWLEQYTENYNGGSKQAKELEKFFKQNYQGSGYIPWATMERMVYEQDPEANFRIRVTGGEFGNSDKIVWTGALEIKTLQNTTEKKIETLAQSITQFIFLELTFLGKTFEEIYPIQDNKYSAPKVIDQNMVNKAIQRAKAKLASRATGLALTLYETGDLQFDETPDVVTKPVKEVKQDSVKQDSVEEGPIVAHMKEVKAKWTPEVVAFAGELRSEEGFNVGLQKINNAIIKKYGFSISAEDPDLEDKLMKIDNLPVFIRTLKTQSGLPV